MQNGRIPLWIAMVKFKWSACDQQYGHETNDSSNLIRTKLSSHFGSSGTLATFTWLQDHLVCDVICSFFGKSESLTSTQEVKSSKLDAELIRDFSRFLKFVAFVQSLQFQTPKMTSLLTLSLFRTLESTLSLPLLVVLVHGSVFSFLASISLRHQENVSPRMFKLIRHTHTGHSLWSVSCSFHSLHHWGECCVRITSFPVCYEYYYLCYK